MSQTEEEYRQARARRRELRRNRQTLVFGTAIVGLVVVGILGLAIGTGLLPSPIQKTFTTAEPKSVLPSPWCPTGDRMPVAPSKITVSVANGSPRPGLAQKAMDDLKARQFHVVGKPTNWNNFGVAQSAEIYFGPKGANQAYTVAGFIDGAVLSPDNRDDDTVTVVVGRFYNGLVASADMTFSLEQPIVSPPDCRTHEDAASPSPTPTKK